MVDPQLEGRVVLVTGANHGIGAATARAFAAQGARVFITIESYSRSAAAEMGRYGITVNVVAPGPIQTGYIPPNSKRKGSIEKIEMLYFDEEGPEAKGWLAGRGEDGMDARSQA